MKLFNNLLSKTEYKKAQFAEYADESAGKDFRIKSYYNYFFSYFIIILILIIISTVTYVYAIGMMRESAVAENNGYLSALKYDADETVKQMMTSAMEASFDETLKDFCKIGRSEAEENPLRSLNAVDAFASYKDKLSENSFFFSGKSNTIISFDGAADAEEFLLRKISPKFVREVENHLKSDKKSSFMVANNSGGKEILLFFCNMNELRYDGRIGKIVSVIDTKVFYDLMETVTKTNKGSRCYIESPTFVIGFPDNESLSSYVTGNGSGFYMTEAGGDIVTAYNSRIADWKYICVTPKHIMFQNASTMQILVIINIVLMLLLGMAATMLLVRQNMKPLKKLVMVLEDMGLKTGGVKNEFDFIENVVSAALREKEEIGEIVYKQNKALKLSFLQNLIRGRIVGGDEFKASLKAFNINLVSNSFAVGVFYVKDIDSLFKEEKSLDVSEKQRMASIIMGNILEELIGKHHMGFVVEVSDMQVCLVNVSRERAAFFYSDMEEAVSVARENIKKYFSIDFSASFGNVYSSIKYIPKSYDEALQTINYKNVVGLESIFKYSDILGQNPNGYEYSDEYEREIISSIKCGKAEKASELIGRIIDENIQTKMLSGSDVSDLLVSITASLLKAVNAINEGEKQKYFTEINVILKMVGNATVEEIKTRIVTVINSLCASAQDEIKTKIGTLGEKAIKFIDENYTNSNLSAAAVAESLGVHAAYLSKKFKEQTGEGLLEYINKVRINNAKRILLEENVSVEDAALSVGIASVRSFARIFKKYEGMAPGEWRNAIK